MTQYRSPRLLTPPTEAEEKYPYRRVWFSAIGEVSGLFLVTIILFMLIGFFGVAIPESLWRAVNFLIALCPVFLWFVLSRLRENFVQEPRGQLTLVLITTALATNAVAIPVLDALAVETWLSLAGTFDRILGYAMTIGIIQELTKYIALRFTIWPDGLRMRYDALAYCLTAAVGYATVINLQVAFAGTPSPDVLAARVWSNLALHIAGSTIVAFGLTELRFNPRVFVAMPISIAIAALIVGFSITFRAGLTNGGFALGVSGSRPFFGIVFSLILVIGIFSSIGILLNNSERRARQMEEGAEEQSPWA